ncbi:Crp/Fnr family transcriptional regulator [Azospirillum sp. SYSU D00513]|uniref:Crp/Fnr family transcriptional regulator n=1 Tax=Azospirillum sp. SYSU D00513 TaxID=2812561 RepID=UPI001A9775AA|nr:Crp/Fnr family transcriptional regulator [Azospirillum sp. SYSU D00513]
MQRLTYVAGQFRWTMAGSKLLAGLPESAVLELERASDWFHCAPDDIVLGADERLDGVYFVADGNIRIFHRLDGKREINFAQFGPGDAFGELSVIDGKGRSADAVAVNTAVIAVCPKQAFLDMLMQQPVVAMRLLQKMAGIIRRADQRIANLAAMTGPQRVYAELLRLATPDLTKQGRYVIDPAPYHRDIAAWSGTTTDVVARAFGHLMRSNLMQRQGSSLLLNDRDRINVLIRTESEEIPGGKEPAGSPA